MSAPLPPIGDLTEATSEILFVTRTVKAILAGEVDREGLAAYFDRKARLLDYLAARARGEARLLRAAAESGPPTGGVRTSDVL